MHALNYAAKVAVTICAGVSGSGKSTYALRYLVNAEHRCRFIFDPRGEFAERLRLPLVTQPAELAAAVGRGWVCWDPRASCGVDPETGLPRLDVGLGHFAEFAWQTSAQIGGSNLLLIDELWRYCSPHSIPAALAQVAQDGRKNGLSLFVATQRPNRINEAILNEAREIVCFRLQGKSALASVCSYFDFDPEELRSLPDLHFVAMASSGGVTRGRLEL